MNNDEAAIRAVISEWMSASEAGDLSRILPLMADDVVFLVPGAPPMRKDDFAKLQRENAGKFRMTTESEIKEISLHGDSAYCWAHLRVTVTPTNGAPVSRRSGHTLSIFRKMPNGAWVLARDSNTLAPEPFPG